MQRFAILSDIHGNASALKAVLTHAKAQGITQFINLGDTFYGPLAPKETFSLLQELSCIHILGNQDRFLLEATLAMQKENKTLAFVMQDLPQEAFEWMQALSQTYILKNKLFLCHGTPNSDTTYLLEETLSGEAKLRSLETLEKLIANIQQDVVLCGHTHLARLVELPNGQIILNPGSVGLQAYNDDEPHPHVMQTHSPHARYASIDLTQEDLDINFFELEYDVEEACLQAKEQNRPDWQYYLHYGKSL